MNAAGWVQLLLIVAGFVLITKPLGAWVALEFVIDRESGEPDCELAWAVHREALSRGVLAICEDTKPLYRMQPALTMDPELFRWSCQQVAAAVAAAVAR